MARIHHVKAAQQRYVMVPKLDESGEQIVSAVTRKSGDAKTTKRGRAISRRATVADTSQPQPMPKCGKCGVTIEVGQPYKWVKTKSGVYGGATKIRCAACPTWKPSELSSSKMAGVYAAQEQCAEEIDNCAEVSDLESLRDDLADQIEAVGEEYEESGSNMEEGFGHETSMSDELKEKGESLKSWADEIRSVDFDEFEGEDEIDCDQCDGTGHVDEDGQPDADEREQVECPECSGTGKVDNDDTSERDDWIQEQREKLTDVVDNCPV